MRAVMASVWEFGMWNSKFVWVNRAGPCETCYKHKGKLYQRLEYQRLE